MREALGIETDQPSSLTSPVTIGSVTLTNTAPQTLRVANNLLATGNMSASGGMSAQTLQATQSVTANQTLIVNGIQMTNAGANVLSITDVATNLAGAIRVGGVPVNGIAQLSESGLVFTQQTTGSSTTVLSWDANNTSPTTETVVLNNIRTITSPSIPLTITNCAQMNGETPVTARTGLVTPSGTFTLDGTEQQLNVSAYNLTGGYTYACFGQAYLTWSGGAPPATDKVYFIFRTSSQTNAFDDPNANTRWTIYPAQENAAGLIEVYVSFAGTFLAEANSTLRISVLGAVGTPADYIANFTNLAIQRLNV